jgi:hypothetical protein
MQFSALLINPVRADFTYQRRLQNGACVLPSLDPKPTLESAYEGAADSVRLNRIFLLRAG